MKKILFLMLTFGCVIFGGCKKYLDIKPKGYTIPEFYADYLRLMNGQALYTASTAYPNYLTDDVLAGEDNDPSTSTPLGLLGPFKKNLYEFKNGYVIEPGQTDQFWEPAYSNIYVFNTVINNIENVSDGTVQQKKQLKSEALMGRAFEYLMLVNAYAPHYDPATAAKDLGVPLVLTEDITQPYTRNTVAEVYARIKADVDEAFPNLPATVPNRVRPLKSAGYAFLSKMYLYMGNYTEALNNANEALKLDNALIDYSLYTTKNGQFGRQVTITNPSNPLDVAVAFPQGNLSKESIWYRGSFSTYGFIFAEVYASDDLVATYRSNLPTGAVDKRFTLFYCNGSSNFSGTVLFPGKVLWGSYIQPNLGFNTPELYLIAAECEARVGSKDIAMQQLNTLRDKRIVGNQPLVAANNEEALKIVLDERRRELPFLGITRLVDLKRLNKDSRFAKTIIHIRKGVTYTLPPNDLRYILPVPPNVLALNPTIPVYGR